MSVVSLINICGILILMSSGCFGLIGSLTESNEKIVERTGLYFGNIEHYASMISQKYLNITSFFLITFGSFILLLPFFISNYIDHLIITLPYSHLIIVILVAVLIFLYYFVRIMSSFVIDKLTVSNQIKILANKELKKDDYNLGLIIEILNRRKVKTNKFNCNDIIDFAKKYFKI
ncbi:MAG: hypothetical protein JXR48_15505 [Candidatus Delongbacteria bacterium]|nr:hypothetical protein [Candidatus Delongbacteria bacterium]MBN2836362.1 hypothetical protein [Candidatus Delongbacteria bacterium]